MAISGELPGVEVTIRVHGQPLQEYEESLPMARERTVIRYIEIVEGQEFAIHLEAKQGTDLEGDCLAFFLFVDGQPISSPFLSPTLQTGDEYRVEGVENVLGMIQKFSFRRIKIATDGNTFDENAANTNRLGDIVIAVGHRRFGQQHPGVFRHDTIPEVGTLSEKAIKGTAVSHNITLGDAVPHPRRQESEDRSVRRLPDTPDPAAIFVFRYRSKEALKSLLIIPRTPSPIPLEDRKASTMTEAEIAQLQKQVKVRNIQ